MKRKNSPRKDDAYSTSPVGSGKLARWRGQASLFNPRDYWWAILDYFEARAARRRALYVTLGLIVALIAAWIWAYPWWARRNAIEIAQEWLAAGNLRNAADAAKRASELAPDRPEPWLIAAELARRGNQHAEALDYSRRAAELAPEDADVQITHAAAALRAGQAAEATKVLDALPADKIAASPDAQRLRGEIARQNLQLTAARDFFEAAIKLEGPRAVNEVPLGLILLQSTDPALRQRGIDLLTKWSTDPEWSVTASRTLLADALSRDDLPTMARWGDALYRNPARTVGDMPNALHALSRGDEVRFKTVLAELEKNHAVTPAAATQLLSWLNQIGRGADAVRWMKTLPADALQRPPLIGAAAEAYRVSADWNALATWTDGGTWTGETDFLRWVYGLVAARELRREEKAGEYQRTLLSRAQLNGVHGLFAASTLYSWGRVPEALALWWRVAEQESRIAIDALGALARHYQLQRDADGQYQAFRRLQALQPADPDTKNNFAFFAAATGREQRLAERLARENVEKYPDNRDYLATLAFTLLQQGRSGEALSTLQSRASEAMTRPGLGFAYGLALAANGKSAEARPLLESIPPETLTLTEVELIRKALAGDRR